MARVRLSAMARADIRAILAASQTTWGVAAANRYADTLASLVQTIAGAPTGPLTRDRSDLLPGLRSAHTRVARGTRGVRAPVHVVFFRVAPDVIEVVRILHERMDVQTQLRASAARTRRARPRR